jgi:hypothetical protein
MGEEETPDEDSSPLVFGNLSDNIFQENFETVHPYNAQSKVQNKLPPETSMNMVSKQLKQIETKQNPVSQVLEYDLVEDLKRLRENISIFELLKFPLILHKIFQSIVDNNKNIDSRNKKSTKNDPNKTKDVSDKKQFENQDKRDISEKTIGNLDKTV